MTRFHNKHARLLEVGLQNEKVMALAGAMVAYEGSMKFEKSILGGEGLFGALKRRVTGEGVPLMVTQGSGTVYFARDAMEVTVMSLSGEKMYVESRHLLAFDQGLRSNSEFVGMNAALGSMAGGRGLFTTSLEGRGSVAVLSHGPIIALAVTPGTPLSVDPDVIVGYRGQLQQDFILDLNWKDFAGQSSGEGFQVRFSGQGTVYIQPAESK
jgi:uncharacterized protein (AIM24 family)